MTVDTRTALLDVAEQAARHRGYDAFSFADLASAVEIRKASVHYHFATKAVLAEVLMARYHARVAQRLSEIDKETGPASEKLEAFLSIYREALGTGETLCLCVSFSASQTSLPDTVSRRMELYRNAVLAWLEAVFNQVSLNSGLEQPGAPEDEATALLALAEGAQLMARTARDPALFDKATALFRKRLH